MKKALLILALVFTACSATKQVAKLPDTLPTVTRQSADTRHMVDSIYVDRWHIIEQKGDTVYQRDSIDRWHVTTITDSIIRIDSVPYPVQLPPDTIYQNELTGQQQFLLRSGRALWAILALLALAVVIGIITKFSRR